MRYLPSAPERNTKLTTIRSGVCLNWFPTTVRTVSINSRSDFVSWMRGNTTSTERSRPLNPVEADLRLEPDGLLELAFDGLCLLRALLHRTDGVAGDKAERESNDCHEPQHQPRSH
jgi:hypothetical protein